MIPSAACSGLFLSLVLATAAGAEPLPGGVPHREVVSEALALVDALPSGGRDLSLTLELAEGEPDPVTGDATLAASPRIQLALPFARGRLGVTADVGIDPDGGVLESPGASLKLLLRPPEGGRTRIAASLDAVFSTRALRDGEAGLGLNVIRALGAVTFRGDAALATGVRDWSPHLHAGISGAVAWGSRWRALAEVVADVSGGEATVSAGPAAKVALGDRTAIMAGALFQVAPAAATPIVTVQLTRGL